MGQDDGRWADAACRNASPKEQKYFFPEKGRPSLTPKYKVFCDTCPIRAFCLSYAIVHDEDGVWGGMTTKERDRLLKSQPYLKDRLTEEARNQGWLEIRHSVDEILAPALQNRPEQIESEDQSQIQETQEEPKLPQAQVTALSFEFRIEEFVLPVPVIPEQTLPTFDVPLVELLAEVPLPIFPRQSCGDSIQFPPLEVLLLGASQSNMQQHGS